MSRILDIAICDDESIFIDRTSEYINSASKVQGIKCNIHTCQSGVELIELCGVKKIDAVFLDIAMPGIDGFKTAEELLKLRSNLVLIFVSSQETMVFSSYEYNPFWFVPKSQLSMLELVINKLFKKLENTASENSIIAINIENNRMVEIDTHKITYFRTDDHYVRIITKDNGKSDSYRYKLDYIEKQLQDSWFVRVHNRYLVNCRMISIIEKNACVLTNGEHVPISRVHMASAKSMFQKYLRSKR